MIFEKKTKNNSGLGILSKVGIFALSLFATASAIYIYSPVIRTNAAESADINVTIRDAMAVVFPDDQQQTYEGAGFTYMNLDTTVTTNSQYGYSITFSAQGRQTSLKNGDFEIQTVSSTLQDPSYMANNTWGYLNQYKDSPKVHPVAIQVSPDLIREVRHPVTEETTTIPAYFKLGDVSTLAAGRYSTNVVISVYTNGVEDFVPPRGRTDPTTCETKNYVQDGILTDPRDGNQYTVAVLADNNCWMTQNLRLTGPMTLTPNTTNIADTYELPASTPVDGWQYERIDSVTVDPNVSKLYASGNYDYGTYYNWYTATAGYASSAPNYTSQYSICPKGWHLPTERQWYDLTVPYSGEEGDMSSDIATAEPISMVYAGAVYAGAYYNSYTPYMDWQDDVGYYWSATAPGYLGPLSFDVYDNDNTTGYEHNHALTIQHTYRGDGYSIRCVAL